MFTRWDITPLKMNRFGRNVEHSEHILGGWLRLWQILGAIRAAARAGEPGEVLFLSGK